MKVICANDKCQREMLFVGEIVTDDDERRDLYFCVNCGAETLRQPRANDYARSAPDMYPDDEDTQPMPALKDAQS